MNFLLEHPRQPPFLLALIIRYGVRKWAVPGLQTGCGPLWLEFSSLSRHFKETPFPGLGFFFFNFFGIY